MNCLMAEEHFSAYLEDELAYQTIKEFETHLTECGSCSSEFVAFRKSVSLIHQLPRIEPSSDFDRTVQSRVGDLDVDRVPVWHQILDSLRARPVWAFSGIAAILLVALVSAYFYQSGLDVYKPSAPRIVVDTDPIPAFRRVDRMDNPGLMALPVRQVNVPLDIGREVSEWRPQRTQQNFILQTVNYSSAPRGGGL